MRKLKILHILSGDLWAGAEVMAFHLLKELASHSDVELCVILLNEGRLAEELRAAEIKIHVFDESRCSFWQLARLIRYVISVNPPDIIHSHRYKENLLVFLASRFLKRSKLITTQHGLPENDIGKASFLVRIKAKANIHVMAHHFDKVIAVSKNIADFFIDEHCFSSMRLKVIHNGIDLDRISPPQKPSAPFVFGSSGRLFPVKGYPLLVDIASLITTSGDISVMLAGDGPVMGELDTAIKRNALEKSFKLAGYVDNMNSFYSGLDFYINTSYHEGIPMTILEAMAYGLPVIAPKVGGIPEIIEDGVEGFLIDGRNPRDYADKCLLLYNDKELWNRMSIAARERVCRDFSREQMADRYLECYREVLA